MDQGIPKRCVQPSCGKIPRWLGILLRKNVQVQVAIVPLSTAVLHQQNVEGYHYQIVTTGRK